MRLVNRESGVLCEHCRERKQSAVLLDLIDIGSVGISIYLCPACIEKAAGLQGLPKPKAEWTRVADALPPVGEPVMVVFDGRARPGVFWIAQTASDGRYWTNGPVLRHYEADDQWQPVTLPEGWAKPEGWEG